MKEKIDDPFVGKFIVEEEVKKPKKKGFFGWKSGKDETETVYRVDRDKIEDFILELQDQTNSQTKEDRMKKMMKVYNSAKLAGEVSYSGATKGAMYSNLG